MPDELSAMPQMMPPPTMNTSRMMPSGPTGPATAPTGNAGMQQRVPMLVELAMKPLKEAAKLLDPTSEEGQALHKALMTLAAKFGKPGDDLSKAEAKLLGEKAPGVAPSNPQAFKAAMQQQAAQRIPPAPMMAGPSAT